MSTLGQFLKTERLNRNLSLRAFSKEIGISHTYLSNLEKGSDANGNPVSPTLEKLIQISQSLNIEIDIFLEECGYLNFKKNQFDLINQIDNLLFYLKINPIIKINNSNVSNDDLYLLIQLLEKYKYDVNDKYKIN